VSGDRRVHLDRLAVSLVIGCTVVWGLGQVASKMALDEVPPLTQAGLRSIGAALLVLAWAKLRGIPLWERDRTLGPGLVAGALFAAEFAAVYSALQFTTAGRMTVFLYTAPFVVAIGMPFIARAERLTGLALAGLIAAFAGVGFAFADSFTSAGAGSQQWLGDLLAGLAALGWGATTLVIRATALAPIHPAKTLLYQLGVSGVGLTAIGWFVGERAQWPLSMTVAAAPGVPGRRRRLHELRRVVLAHPDLLRDETVGLHAVDPGRRARRWRRAAARAGQSPHRGCARRRLPRARRRQPPLIPLRRPLPGRGIPP
jgi:drug/metabolite transporter (DMT)-like permease